MSDADGDSVVYFVRGSSVIRYRRRCCVCVAVVVVVVVGIVCSISVSKKERLLSACT